MSYNIPDWFNTTGLKQKTLYNIYNDKMRLYFRCELDLPYRTGLIPLVYVDIDLDDGHAMLMLHKDRSA